MPDDAGGLGVLAGLNVPPDDLRAMIRRVRELTDRPFGVNLWLHRALRPPLDPGEISDEIVRGAQGMLNRFRQNLGIPTTMARPGRAPDLVEPAIQVVLDERPPVFSAALGGLEPAFARECRARGINTMAMVSTVDDARAAPRAAPTSSWPRGTRRAAIGRSTASPCRSTRPASG
jgi:nitronate monooxygenase